MPVRRLYELSRRKKQLAVENGSEGSLPPKADPERTKGEDTGKEQATVATEGHTDFFSLSPLPEEVQRLIIEYRTEDPGAGFKRIEDRLKSDHLVVVGRKQIRHVLKSHGLLEVHDSSFDLQKEGGKGSRRFEASHAGEMYQMDVTYVYLSGIPVQYLVVIVDDHSRFCVSAEFVSRPEG